MLEGYPCKRVNETFFIEPARKSSDLVILPQLTPLEGIAESNWGKAESLPSVQISAYFTSSATRGPDGHLSRLAVTWWQDDFIRDLDGELTALLGAIAWWSHARELSVGDL